jgi:hypothetical protein
VRTEMCSKVLCNLLAEVVQVVCSYVQGLVVVLFMHTALISLDCFLLHRSKILWLDCSTKVLQTRKFSVIGLEIEKA